MRGIELQFKHNSKDCKGIVIPEQVLILADYSLVVIGRCGECGTQIQLSNRLSRLYEMCKEMRRRPVVPPIQMPLLPAPAPKFTEEDVTRLHGLGIKFTEGETA